MLSSPKGYHKYNPDLHIHFHVCVLSFHRYTSIIIIPREFSICYCKKKVTDMAKIYCIQGYRAQVETCRRSSNQQYRCG